MGLAYIQYGINIWRFKKFVGFGSHKIYQLFKKGSCPLLKTEIDLISPPQYSPDLAPIDLFSHKKWIEKSAIFDTWRNGCCIQNNYFGCTSIREAKVLRQLFLKRAKMFKSSWRIFWGTVELEWFWIINICFYPLIPI